MKKEYSINCNFLDLNRSVLGIEHTNGRLTEVDGTVKNYKEFILGFLFFYISFMTTTQRGEQ
jgi:hypothetical protein